MREILEATGATSFTREARIQSLWSGYGELFRARLGGVDPEQVVVKLVEPPTERHHPRGWHTSLGHERKLRSYDVEQAFYAEYAPRCGSPGRVARRIASARQDDRWWLVLEDLDVLGFGARRHHLGPKETQACLRWLADFHATFMGVAPEGLWEVGTYWHLATRPDELAATEDAALVEAAPIIDARLNACRHQTLVHGDAKVANFCFAPDGREVAAVDFQYVGGGCGMKDLAYFSSCFAGLTEVEAARHLDDYFAALRTSLRTRAPELDPDALEAEWRELYPLAWADLYRFLAGWAPDHYRLDECGWSLTQRALRAL